jgi:hypothetical protein
MAKRHKWRGKRLEHRDRWPMRRCPYVISAVDGMVYEWLLAHPNRGLTLHDFRNLKND